MKRSEGLYLQVAAATNAIESWTQESVESFFETGHFARPVDSTSPQWAVGFIEGAAAALGMTALELLDDLAAETVTESALTKKPLD